MSNEETLKAVISYIREEGWTKNEIDDDFIIGWFDYFSDKYDNPYKIAEAIIDEWDIAMNYYPYNDFTID